MNERATFGDDDVLVIVDIQYDFCPGGALSVPHAFVIEDACRGIDIGGSVAASRASFAERGIACINAREFA